MIKMFKATNKKTTLDNAKIFAKPNSTSYVFPDMKQDAYGRNLANSGQRFVPFKLKKWILKSNEDFLDGDIRGPSVCISLHNREDI